MNRRNFLSRGGMALASTALPPFAEAKQTPSISQYRKAKDFTRPDFPIGTRLLFQGDSITDMKWGRNQADRTITSGIVMSSLLQVVSEWICQKQNLSFLTGE